MRSHKPDALNWIPALGRLRREASLHYIARPWLKIKQSQEFKMFVEAPIHPYVLFYWLEQSTCYSGIYNVGNFPPWWLASYYLLFGSSISYLVTEPLGRAQQTCLLMPAQQLAYLVHIFHGFMDHEHLLKFYENKLRLRESQCLGWR